MSLSLRRAVGSLLVVGLEGVELSALERAWMRVIRPGGIILFRRNIQDAQQTRALLDAATGLCAAHAFRCVDVEGGTVDRLRDALAPMPSPQSVAQAARHTTGSLAKKHGELIARGVRAFGFNTTLAPVLDLGLPESASVMGSRTAGANAEEVTTYARQFLAGLTAHHVAGCGKHFPGLGAGQLDSHFDTPIIQRDFKTIEREDLAPYAALVRELPMIMVNHAAYPATRGGDVPATASPFWIQTVLREKLGYRGIIFSDDLEMGGILKRMPMEEAVVAAVRAGMDTLEICHNPELILRAYEGLLAEAERSTAFRRLIESRAREVARKKSRLFSPGTPKALTSAQFNKLRNDIASFRERVPSLSSTQTPSPKSHKPIVETA